MDVLICTICGAVIGAAIGFGIWACLALFSYVTCGLFGGAGNMMSFVTFCLVPGIIIGFVFGVLAQMSDSKDKRFASEEEAKKQRIKWAGEIKQISAEVSASCKTGNDYHDIVSYDLEAMNKREHILKELSETGMLMGKVESAAKKVNG